MTTKNENYLSMCRTTNDVLVKHSAVWQPNKRFAKECETFAGLINNASDTKTAATIVTTGATADKADAAVALYSKTVDLSKRASIYALDTNNQELHDQLRTSKGSLSSMHDSLSLAKAKDVCSRIEAISGELTDYGITEQDITELKQLIDAYDALMCRPRGLVVERKGHNQTIPELIRALRQSIYKLDSLINLFSSTPLETDYRNARVIMDLGSRKRKEEN